MWSRILRQKRQEREAALRNARAARDELRARDELHRPAGRIDKKAPATRERPEATTHREVTP